MQDHSGYTVRLASAGELRVLLAQRGINSNEYRKRFVFTIGGSKTMRVARPVVPSSNQQKMLESRARARSAPARNVERGRIVLLAGTGLQDQQIAAKLKIALEKAGRWRNRFLDGGLAGLDSQSDQSSGKGQARSPRAG